MSHRWDEEKLKCDLKVIAEIEGGFVYYWTAKVQDGLRDSFAKIVDYEGLLWMDQGRA